MMVNRVRSLSTPTTLASASIPHRPNNNNNTLLRHLLVLSTIVSAMFVLTTSFGVLTQTTTTLSPIVFSHGLLTVATRDYVCYNCTISDSMRFDIPSMIESAYVVAAPSINVVFDGPSINYRILTIDARNILSNPTNISLSLRFISLGDVRSTLFVLQGAMPSGSSLDFTGTFQWYRGFSGGSTYFTTLFHFDSLEIINTTITIHNMYVNFTDNDLEDDVHGLVVIDVNTVVSEGSVVNISNTDYYVSARDTVQVVLHPTYVALIMLSETASMNISSSSLVVINNCKLTIDSDLASQGSMFASTAMVMSGAINVTDGSAFEVTNSIVQPDRGFKRLVHTSVLLTVTLHADTNSIIKVHNTTIQFCSAVYGVYISQGIITHSPIIRINNNSTLHIEDNHIDCVSATPLDTQRSILNLGNFKNKLRINDESLMVITCNVISLNGRDAAAVILSTGGEWGADGASSIEVTSNSVKVTTPSDHQIGFIVSCSSTPIDIFNSSSFTVSRNVVQAESSIPNRVHSTGLIILANSSAWSVYDSNVSITGNTVNAYNFEGASESDHHFSLETYAGSTIICSGANGTFIFDNNTQTTRYIGFGSVGVVSLYSLEIYDGFKVTFHSNSADIKTVTNSKATLVTFAIVTLTFIGPSSSLTIANNFVEGYCSTESSALSQYVFTVGIALPEVKMGDKFEFIGGANLVILGNNFMFKRVTMASLARWYPAMIVISYGFSKRLEVEISGNQLKLADDFADGKLTSSYLQCVYVVVEKGVSCALPGPLGPSSVVPTDIAAVVMGVTEVALLSVTNISSNTFEILVPQATTVDDLIGAAYTKLSIQPTQPPTFNVEKNSLYIWNSTSDALLIASPPQQFPTLLVANVSLSGGMLEMFSCRNHLQQDTCSTPLTCMTPYGLNVIECVPSPTITKTSSHVASNTTSATRTTSHVKTLSSTQSESPTISDHSLSSSLLTKTKSRARTATPSAITTTPSNTHHTTSLSQTSNMSSTTSLSRASQSKTFVTITSTPAVSATQTSTRNTPSRIHTATPTIPTACNIGSNGNTSSLRCGGVVGVQIRKIHTTIPKQPLIYNSTTSLQFISTTSFNSTTSCSPPPIIPHYLPGNNNGIVIVAVEYIILLDAWVGAIMNWTQQRDPVPRIISTKISQQGPSVGSVVTNVTYLQPLPTFGGGNNNIKRYIEVGILQVITHNPQTFGGDNDEATLGSMDIPLSWLSCIPYLYSQPTSPTPLSINFRINGPQIETLTEAERVAVAVVSALGGVVASDLQTVAVLGISGCSSTPAGASPQNIRALIPVALSNDCEGAVSGGVLFLCVAGIANVGVALSIYYIRNRKERLLLLNKKKTKKDHQPTAASTTNQSDSDIDDGDLGPQSSSSTSPLSHYPPHTSLIAALAAARCPSLFLLVGAFFQMGFVACGGQLLLQDNPSLALGSLGILLGIIQLPLYPLLAMFIVSRRCYRLQPIITIVKQEAIEADGGTTPPSVKKPKIRSLREIALSTILPFILHGSELDNQRYPISQAFSQIVGKQRFPGAGWAGLQVLMPVVLMVCIFAQGVTCTPLYGFAAGVFAMVAIAVTILRPHRNPISNIFHGVGMLLNAALLGISAALVATPYDTGAISGTRVVAMMQVGLTVLRIIHSVISTILFFKYRQTWFQRVSYFPRKTPSSALQIGDAGDITDSQIIPIFDVQGRCFVTTSSSTVSDTGDGNHQQAGAVLALPLIDGTEDGVHINNSNDQFSERLSVGDEDDVAAVEVNEEDEIGEDGLTRKEAKIVHSYVRKVRHFDGGCRGRNEEGDESGSSEMGSMHSDDDISV